MRLAPILAVACSLLAGPAFAAEWGEFNFPDDQFRAIFPGQPRIETTTYKSEYEAELPTRVYSAQDGESRYTITVVDYRPLESILTEKAKTCPRGFERCIGNLGAGPGYWKIDLMGAPTTALRKFLMRDAKMTDLLQELIGFVLGYQLELSNPDGSRTRGLIYMVDYRLYILEGTTPANDPTAMVFRLGFNFRNPVTQVDPQQPRFYQHPVPPAWDPAQVKNQGDVANPEALYRILHPELKLD